MKSKSTEINNRSKLIINEPPVLVAPSLSKILKLSEAMVLQQIHYWIITNRDNDKHLIDGRYWTYITVKDLSYQIKFFDRRTIERAINTLGDKGILIVDSFNNKAYDKTKWYAINYEVLSKLMYENDSSYGQNVATDGQNVATDGQNVAMNGQNVRMEYDKMSKPIPKNYTEMGKEEKRLELLAKLRPKAENTS